MKASKQEMSAVADKAHTICRAASKVKGGKHSEYLSEAFKIAWSMLKLGELFVEKVLTSEEFSALIAKNGFKDDVDYGDEENNNDVTGFEDEVFEDESCDLIGSIVRKNGTTYEYVSDEDFTFTATDSLADYEVKKDGVEFSDACIISNNEDFVFIECVSEDVIIVVPAHKLNIKKSIAVSKLFCLFDDSIYSPERNMSELEMDVLL